MLTHEFQVRDADVTGRTVRLACVPYDQPAPVADDNGEPYLEQFQRGAFRNVVKAPHVVQLLHDHRPGVGFGYARSSPRKPPTWLGSGASPRANQGTSCSPWSLMSSCGACRSGSCPATTPTTTCGSTTS